MIKMENAINIFTDASVLGKIDKHNKNKVCGGAIAVDFNNGRVKEYHCVIDKSTNNYGELTALGLGIQLASIYKDTYERINIFSDSKLSVMSLREWIYGWIRNMNQNYRLLSSTGAEVANQDLIIRITDSIIDNFIPGKHRINIYHCNGHIYNPKDYYKAVRSLSLNFKYRLSEEEFKMLQYYMKIIQRWNNYIDESTRSSLHTMQYGVEYFADVGTLKQCMEYPMTYDLLDQYSRIVSNPYQL